MKIFAIDTSAVAASCALAEDGKIIFEFYTNAGLQHSRTLAPMIESAFKCTEISISDVDCFAVSKGPGSFTGVRIGIAAVKGMAFEKDKPCVGVSTLEAMAYNLECVKGIICSVMSGGNTVSAAISGCMYIWFILLISLIIAGLGGLFSGLSAPADEMPDDSFLRKKKKKKKKQLKL